MNRRYTLLFFCVLIAASLVVTGCSEESAAPADATAAPAPATQVETLTLEPTTFTDVIELTGSVEAIHDATLSAQASGTVISLAELGTYLPKGSRLAQLDSTDAYAALEQAQAQYALALDRYQRQQPLYQDSIITALEFEQVRSELAQARAARARAQKQLRNTRVTVPFAGTVEERFIQPGEQVAPNDPIARVVNVQPAKIVAGVPERYAGEIEKGNAVQIRFKNTRLEERTGTITFVGSTIDSQSRTFTTEAKIPNEDRLVKPEMVAQLRVDRTTMDNTLVIPRTAVIRDEAGTHVYVVEQTDTSAVARKRDITVGTESGARVTVASGLQAGDEVVVVGQSDLAPGEPVNVSTQHERIRTTGTSFASEADAAPSS